MKQYIIRGYAPTPKGGYDTYWCGGVFWSMNKAEAKKLNYRQALAKAREKDEYQIERA